MTPQPREPVELLVGHASSDVDLAPVPARQLVEPDVGALRHQHDTRHPGRSCENRSGSSPSGEVADVGAADPREAAEPEVHPALLLRDHVEPHQQPPEQRVECIAQEPGPVLADPTELPGERRRVGASRRPSSSTSVSSPGPSGEASAASRFQRGDRPIAVGGHDAAVVDQLAERPEGRVLVGDPEQQQLLHAIRRLALLKHRNSPAAAPMSVPNRFGPSVSSTTSVAAGIASAGSVSAAFATSRWKDLVEEPRAASSPACTDGASAGRAALTRGGYPAGTGERGGGRDRGPAGGRCRRRNVEPVPGMHRGARERRSPAQCGTRCVARAVVATPGISATERVGDAAQHRQPVGARTELVAELVDGLLEQQRVQQVPQPGIAPGQQVGAVGRGAVGAEVRRRDGGEPGVRPARELPGVGIATTDERAVRGVMERA